MRLKQASPSVAGSAPPIASMRAIAAATEVTAGSGADGSADMTVTIRSPAPLAQNPAPGGIASACVRVGSLARTQAPVGVRRAGCWR
jgi:hypothetical protein